MAYLLTHRELRPRDTGAACIFCGTHHLCPELDPHTGRVYALHEGRVATFLYCQHPICPQLNADAWAEDSIWCCSCKPSIEVVGWLCPHCKCERVATGMDIDVGDQPRRVGGVYVRMVKVVSKHSMGEHEFNQVLGAMEDAMPEKAILVSNNLGDHVEAVDSFDTPERWWKKPAP